MELLLLCCFGQKRLKEAPIGEKISHCRKTSTVHSPWSKKSITWTCCGRKRFSKLLKGFFCFPGKCVDRFDKSIKNCQNSFFPVSPKNFREKVETEDGCKLNLSHFRWKREPLWLPVDQSFKLGVDRKD